MNQAQSTKCLCRHEDTKHKLGSVYNNRMLIDRKWPIVKVKCKDCWILQEIKYNSIQTTICPCKEKLIWIYDTGILRRDNRWRVICDICWLSFNKLWGHIRYAHEILASDYKLIFWLDNKQSLMSKSSIALARQRNLENYDLVVTQNLIARWDKTRFKEWSKWRTLDKCSTQTLLRLSLMNNNGLQNTME